MIVLKNSLGWFITLPITMSWTDVNSNILVKSAQLSSGPSVVTGLSAYTARRFSLKGIIFFIDKNNIRAEFDTIKNLLQYPPIEVKREDDRYTTAYPTSINEKWIDGGRELEVDISMLAPDPFFYGETATSSRNGIISSDTWTITPEGNTQVYPIITIDLQTGTLVDPVITNGSYEISFDRTFAGSNQITIDCNTMGILVNGQPDIAGINDEWLLHSFPLLQQENTISFSGSGTFNTNVVVEWKAKWL